MEDLYMVGGHRETDHGCPLAYSRPESYPAGVLGALIEAAAGNVWARALLVYPGAVLSTLGTPPVISPPPRHYGDGVGNGNNDPEIQVDRMTRYADNGERRQWTYVSYVQRS